MIREKSCGAVVFRREKNKIFYLILKYNENYWGLPKGHVEKGETELETAIREVREETGIKDFKIIKGFKEKIEYFFKQDGELIHKDVVFFLFETNTVDVKKSFEHMDIKWVQLKEAIEKLTYKTDKEVMKKADIFIKSMKRMSDFE